MAAGKMKSGKMEAGSDERTMQGICLREPMVRIPGMSPAKQAELNLALLSASLHGESEDVARLLKEGADPNVRDIAARNTPIMFAVIAKVDIIKVFQVEGGQTLKRKQKPNVEMQVNPDKSIQTVKVLLANGADIKAKNKDGESVLDIAKSKGHPKVAETIENMLRVAEMLSR